MKNNVLREITQILYPDDIKCVVCGREIVPNRYGLCEKCLLDANVNYCLRCGRHKVGEGDYCDECSDVNLYFDEARSAVNYDGNAKDIVRRLKYGSARYLVRSMCEHMLDVLLLTDWDFDCLTFVPTHKKRLRTRGYNQAELLAREISEHIGAPCLSLLEKVKNTVNQARLSRAERMSNLHDSFAAIEKAPSHIVLVDDVLTTGSTASECARMLKKAGATVVYVLTFASVPERPLLDTHVQKIADFRK